MLQHLNTQLVKNKKIKSVRKKSLTERNAKKKIIVKKH